MVRVERVRHDSDDDWTTWTDGPDSNPLNLETQINDQFVDWGPYSADHHYSHWITGDGNPINLRVLDGDPDTNAPDPAMYGDNTGPVADTGMPAIVFEYALPTT